MNTRVLLVLIALMALGLLAWAQTKPGTLVAPPTNMLHYSTVVYETEFYGIRRLIDQPTPLDTRSQGMRPGQIFEANRSQRRLDIAALQNGIRTRGQNGWTLHSINRISDDAGIVDLALVWERGKPMP